jgi:predicted nucleic acid-binding Zn finger protein
MTAQGKVVAHVRSFNGGGDYTISKTAPGVFSCTCPHFRYRLEGTGKRCKHINDWLGVSTVSDKVTRGTRLLVPLPATVLPHGENGERPPWFDMC